MTYVNTRYATVDDMRSYLRLIDSNDDDDLAIALDSASRAIDRAAMRSFGLDSPAVERHWTFTREAPCFFAGGVTFYVQPITDVSEATGVTVAADKDGDFSYETTLTADQFRLQPVDAGLDALPYTHLAVASDVADGLGIFRIAVTAEFGWTAVPETIRQATMMQANRLFKRRDGPFGIAGSPELGNEMRLLERLDPDVGVLVEHYKRRWAVV